MIWHSLLWTIAKLYFSSIFSPTDCMKTYINQNGDNVSNFTSKSCWCNDISQGSLIGINPLQKGHDNVPVFLKILFKWILLSQNECVSKVFSANSCVCVSVFACGKLAPRLVKLKGDWLLYMIFAKQVGSLQKGRDNVPVFHKILFNRILLSQNECVSKVFSANSCVCACLFVVS
jgi:hypothetical protein